jgi:hypothetical protein
MGLDFYNHIEGKNHQSEACLAKIKRCQLDDVWETYKVSFTVLNSQEEANDSIFLEGNIAGLKKIEMIKTPNTINWMKNKYGETV